MMKRITLVATLLLVATTLFAGETISRGAAIAKDAKSVPLATVLASPAEYTKTPVVVEGVVTNACERKGCWMQLQPAPDADQSVRVTFKDYGFFVPLDSKGMKARAEGVTTVKKLSKAEADHLEEEGAKLKRNEDGSAVEVSFVANGVELTK
ncbi:MAG: DUF4920 domain-containing protein [Thermoanaerobaculia bacterium]